MSDLKIMHKRVSSTYEAALTAVTQFSEAIRHVFDNPPDQLTELTMLYNASFHKYLSAKDAHIQFFKFIDILKEDKEFNAKNKNSKQLFEEMDRFKQQTSALLKKMDSTLVDLTGNYEKIKQGYVGAKAKRLKASHS